MFNCVNYFHPEPDVLQTDFNGLAKRMSTMFRYIRETVLLSETSVRLLDAIVAE